MNEGDVIRLATVGYGRRGRSMSRLAVTFPAVELVAVCDTQPESLQNARADHPNACLFDDFTAMLNEGGIDALLVETPGWDHTGFCLQGVQHGLHVLSDVPFAYTLAEADQLWAAQPASTSIFMCGANPNMWGFVQAAVDLCKAGLLGEPYYLEADYVHDLRHLFDKTPWRRQFPCIKYCTHSLGPLLRILSDDLVEVSCFATGSQVSGIAGYSDVMTALYKTANGAVLKLTVSFANQFKGGYHSYRVFGSEGYFERFSGRGKIAEPFTMFNSTKLAGAQNPVKLDIDTLLPEYGAAAANSGHGGADHALFDRFFAAIRANAPSPISLREGLRMTIPGIFAERSATLGGEKLAITYPWNAD